MVMYKEKDESVNETGAPVQYNIALKSNYLFIRRYLDLILIIMSIPIVIPLFIFVAIILLFHFRGNIFYTQKRAGYLGEPFTMYKFRTMIDCSSEDENFLVPCNERVTKLCAFLRRHRIDEIPQIYNVFMGDMSLIGPRPEVYFHYEYFSEKIQSYKLRKIIPQGISGWAQVNYPHTFTLDETIEKLNYDLIYIKNLSFKLDLIIAFKTIIQMFTGKNS